MLKSYRTKNKKYKIECFQPPYQFKKSNTLHYRIRVEVGRWGFDYDIYLSRNKIEKFNLTDDSAERIIEGKLIDFLDNEVEEYKKIIVGDDDIEKFLYNRKMEAVIQLLDEKGILRSDELNSELVKMGIIRLDKGD